MNATALAEVSRHWTDRDTLTMSEAAEILGLGRTAAYEAARRQEIPVLRIGGRMVVPVPLLKALLGYSTGSA